VNAWDPNGLDCKNTDPDHPCELPEFPWDNNHCNATCRRNAGAAMGVCLEEMMQDCASEGGAGCAIMSAVDMCADPGSILDPPPDPVPQSQPTPKRNLGACAVDIGLFGAAFALDLTGAREVYAGLKAARLAGSAIERIGLMSIAAPAGEATGHVLTGTYINGLAGADAITTASLGSDFGLRRLEWKGALLTIAATFLPGVAEAQAIGNALDDCRAH
jgi:hypothetical protein